MDIMIHCAGMPFDGTTIPSGKSLGGSESACYFMARELARLGHRVMVFTSDPNAQGRHDGVVYAWHGNMTNQMPMGEIWTKEIAHPHDVCIIQRHPFGFRAVPNSKINLFWTHDLALKSRAAMILPQLSVVDRVVTVSEWHAGQTNKVYGIDKKSIFPARNGVDYSMMGGLQKAKRKPRSLVYAGRPERGLHELVRPGGVMEQLPDCHLYVCGYDNTTEQMRGYYQYLWSRCEELPNVTNLGALGKRELYKLLASSELYVYPSTFEETSCILALECNAVGTPLIGCEVGALPETIGDAGAVLVPLTEDRKVDSAAFVKAVLESLEPERWAELNQKALAKNQAWADEAARWDELFKDILRARCDNRYRLHRHLENYSDIAALYLDGGKAKGNYEFFEIGTPEAYDEHYRKYYEHEKSKGVNYGPENVQPMPRFQAVTHFANAINPRSILDYGCAHGSFPMNMAPLMPNVQFMGIDIAHSNIEIARAWAEKEGVSDRVKFAQGRIGAMPESLGKFDVVMANEVIEHIHDFRTVIESLKAYVSNKGIMIMTVPFGPWEALGWNLPQNIGWRAHIHHFERADLDEIFGNQPGYQCISISADQFPGCGHWLVTFKGGGPEVGTINYDRKLHTQAPMETLSVCIIARNAEHTLGKTLGKVAGIADEIIVGIDETTTDETERVARKFGAQTFTIKSPLEIGFDEARNLTIERATMDWILWLDADESLEHAERLPKYLRPNPFMAYNLEQQHHAVEPAGVLQTDKPCRLFRNRAGIRFFGVVHEHPEFALNKGIGMTIGIPDVEIMHDGYATEDIRRRRFVRNFPLMQRDREKYPERELGHLLWVRDLMHEAKYSIEQRRAHPQNIKALATEAIKTWRHLVEIGNLRLVEEAIPYYSEAVRYLGPGIECMCGMATFDAPGERKIKPVLGIFANPDDIRAYTALLTKHILSRHEGDYC